MSYLYVKWNSFGRGLLASRLATKARRASSWPLPERRPATPQVARLGGSGQRRSLRRVSSRRHPGEHRRPRRLHYFRLARDPGVIPRGVANRLEKEVTANP